MKHKVAILFKNGKEIIVRCDNFRVKTNGVNELISYEYEGSVDNHLLFVDFSEVAAIYQIIGGESND